MNHGRCLCGAVRYEIDGPFVEVVHCHCSMCRKHHGTAFVTWAVAPLEGFRLTAGQEAIVSRESSPGVQRSFCSTCGSVTPQVSPSGKHVIAAAGNLVDAVGLTPYAHIFTGSKASWYTITDDLPQHAEFPPEYGLAAVARAPAPATGHQMQGSCLCGEVAYEVDAPPQRTYYCHCSRCRLARGAAHATNAIFRSEDFRWTRGGDQVSVFKLPEAKLFGQAFCRRCGSHVPRVAPERNVASVPAGTLDGTPAIAPTAHIYVESRAGWEVLPDDGVTRYAGPPA
jgi:hypothetical protein